MHTPAPDVREKLWANVAGSFNLAARQLLAARRTKSGTTKLQVLEELLKLAYQAGIDRGYDMGHSVFGQE